MLHDVVSEHLSHSSIMHFQHKNPYSKVAEAIIKILIDGPYSDMLYLVAVWDFKNKLMLETHNLLTFLSKSLICTSMGRTIDRGNRAG